MYKLKYDYQKPIIGFSATPLREKAEFKLKDIFSTTYIKDSVKQLNIISSYGYADAVTDKIILPFTYHYVEINQDNHFFVSLIK